MKHISNYQHLKLIYDGLKTAKDEAAYRNEHESDLILFEAATKALRKVADGNGGKLPNLAMLKADYARLTDKKNMLRAEYDKLKLKSWEYGIVLRNVDSILNPSTERAREKERGTEL